LFTGLIEEKGTIKGVAMANGAADLVVAAPLVSQDVKIGDSVAINGCCLTVVKIDEQFLTFQAGSETLNRTNLGLLESGSKVNLERALMAGQPMGGHYVSGHVDAIGIVDQRNDDGQWVEFWFKVPAELTRQMASKGSVTVDGVSLTLVGVNTDRFSVALIPHTLEITTLGDRTVGDSVNIETDLLAKYVQQQMEHRQKADLN